MSPPHSTPCLGTSGAFYSICNTSRDLSRQTPTILPTHKLSGICKGTKVHPLDESQPRHKPKCDVARSIFFLYFYLCSHPRLLLFLIANLCTWMTSITFTVRLSNICLSAFQVPSRHERARALYQESTNMLEEASYCIMSAVDAEEDVIIDRVLTFVKPEMEKLHTNQMTIQSLERSLTECLSSILADIMKNSSLDDVCYSQLEADLFGIVAMFDDPATLTQISQLLLRVKWTRLMDQVELQSEKLQQPDSHLLVRAISNIGDKLIQQVESSAKSQAMQIRQWIMHHQFNASDTLRPGPKIENANSRTGSVLAHFGANAVRQQLHRVSSDVLLEVYDHSTFVREAVAILNALNLSNTHMLQSVRENLRVNELQALKELQSLTHRYKKIFLEYYNRSAMLARKVDTFLQSPDNNQSAVPSEDSITHHKVHWVPRRSDKFQSTLQVPTVGQSHDGHVDDREYLTPSNSNILLNFSQHKSLLHIYLTLFDAVVNVCVICTLGVKIFFGYCVEDKILDVRDLSLSYTMSNYLGNIPSLQRVAKTFFKLARYVSLYCKPALKRLGIISIIFIITASLSTWRSSLHASCSVEDIAITHTQRDATWEAAIDYIFSSLHRSQSTSPQLALIQERLKTSYEKTCHDLKVQELEPLWKHQKERFAKLKQQIVQSKKLITTASCNAGSDRLYLKASRSCKQIRQALLQLDTRTCKKMSVAQEWTDIITIRCLHTLHHPLDQVKFSQRCSFEQLMYFSISIFWLRFIVFIVCRLMAYSVFKMLALSFWRELSNARTQCLVFCDENGSLDHMTTLQKRLRGNAKRRNVEIKLRGCMLVAGVLSTGFLLRALYSDK